MSEALPRPASRRVLLIPLLSVLVLALYLAVLVFRPFFLEFTVAASVALLLGPLQRSLSRALGGRSTLAAALLVLLATVVILVPVLSLAALLRSQAGTFFEWLRPHLQPSELQRLWKEALLPRVPWLEDWLHEEQMAGLLSTSLSQIAAGVNGLIQHAVAGITAALFDLMLFLMMLFFLLKDGGALRDELRHVSPLSPEQETQIFSHLGRTVKGVLQAMVLVPLAQGLLAVVGFWLFGVPSALLWGVMVVLAALVPIVGSPLGWGPACIYLAATGSAWQAVGMFLYGALVISTVDNLVKPMLLREAAQIHPLLGFLSILGGLIAFGPLGFLVGPVILSLVLSAIRIYRLDVLRGRGAVAAARGV